MRAVSMLLAGAILLAIADVAPKFAVGTAGVLLLGAIITNPSELQNTAAFISGLTKGGVSLGK